MSVSDPVGDMLTRIRNAQMRGKSTVRSPSSKLRGWVLDVLKAEGYIRGYEQVTTDAGHTELEISLKYFEGRPVIERLERFSRSGLRQYRGKSELPKVLGGLGVAIISTSSGLLTDKQAASKGVGGEVLAYVW